MTRGFLEQNRGDQDAVAETAWEFLNVKSGSKLAATLAEEAISREGYLEEQPAALMPEFKTSEAPLI